MNQAALVVQGLSVSAAGRPLVSSLTLAVRPGAPVTLLGETGAGKSLVARAVLGALPASLHAEGRVILNGARLDRLAPRARRTLWGRRIALLPQESWVALDPTMRIGAQVAEAARLVAGMGAAQARAAARAALDEVGLGGAARCYPHELSGGMAQRAAFAAATVAGAGILIADEPTKSLDAAMRDRVAALLARVTARGGSLVTITHDVALARALGGHLAILRAGRVLEEGPAAQVLAAPATDYGRALVAAEPRRWHRAVATGSTCPMRPMRPDPSTPICSSPRLSCRNLRLERGGRTLLSGLNLDIRAGDRVAVTGPSGSGKTTLLNALGGLLAPSGGAVARGPGVARFGVQKLYQDPPSAFAPGRSLGRSLRDVARRHGLSLAPTYQRLQRLGIDRALLQRRPREVSGGELQRIAVARALALDPAVLLADEPTSRLDLITQRALVDLLGEMADQEGLAVVLVTHDSDIAVRWAHRMIDVATHAPGAESNSTPQRL